MEKTLNDLLDEHFQARAKLDYLKERKKMAEQEVKHFDQKIASMERSIEEISTLIINRNK